MGTQMTWPIAFRLAGPVGILALGAGMYLGTVAAAARGDIGISSGNTEAAVAQAPCTEVFPELPALAKRLGVPPGAATVPAGAIVMSMCNGDEYDLFALINALLDRIDQRLLLPETVP